jgi:hypothetical protein
MRLVVLFAVSSLVAPSVGASQTSPSQVSRTKLIVVNMALGGITSGAMQAAKGGSFWKGFAKGSAGGAFVFGGKCLIAQRSSLGYWLGREVVAVGSSVVRNASAGRGAFDELVLPLGPIWIHRDNKARTQIVKVDFAQVAVATYFASNPKATFKSWKSFWSGGLIFDDSTEIENVEAAGVIRLRAEDSDPVMAHETIHVAQDEFMSIAWGDPFEKWLLGFIPGGDKVHRYVALGLLQPMWAVADARIALWDRPWEKEAHSFDRRC